MKQMLFAGVLLAQTVITPHPNKYSPADDVKLGLQAKAEAERQLPILHDELVTSYVEGLGRRLVAGIPPELRHPEFRYSFEVVNVREINAFALPGGPMFINRGMIEAARSEGEVAGVMAHELSHVVLRHGTAQASKATKYELGALAGAVVGSIVGGRLGSVIAQGTQFGLGTAFLRFSREYEREADLEGTHIMARAGYDPRDMANVFKAIEEKGGAGGPEWLSDHPNPGNRFEYITQEAARLRVENPVRNSQAFNDVRARLQRFPPAPTTEEVTRSTSRGSSSAADGRPSGRVEPPSPQMTTYTEGNLFRVSVPSNWRELPGSSAVTFAPEGAYGQSNGQNVFTHGVEIGVARHETHDLDRATAELIDSLARGNPGLSRPSRYKEVALDGRRGLQALMTNASAETRRAETIAVYTTQLRDGSLFYVIGVVPRDESGLYDRTLQQIVESIRLTDGG